MNDIFSPMETKILKIIGSRKAISIAQITEELYRGKKTPFAANNNVASSVRRINAKCDYHKLDWNLNSMGTGRAGKQVWRDKR